MDLFFTPEAGLWGLFLSSFLAATLLPGGSEFIFVGLLALHPELKWEALFLATAGNTLGGMSSYWMARALPESAVQKLGERSLSLAKRWGAAVLLLAWAPIIGDLLCVAAGWLRLPWLPCAIWMVLGKLLRYAVLLAGVMGVMAW